MNKIRNYAYIAVFLVIIISELPEKLLLNLSNTRFE